MATGGASAVALAAVLAVLVVAAEGAVGEDEGDIGDRVGGLIQLLALRERQAFQEPRDYRGPRRVFDFIVVGAGAAGSAVASRLSEVRGWSVLLLEAGGEEPPAMNIPLFSGALPFADWGYTCAPQLHGGCPSGPGARCPYPRGKVMGGSTSVNLMIATRGDRHGYDDWARLGNTGWDYDSILPLFKRMENMQIPSLRNSSYHGTGGNIMISRPYETWFAEAAIAAAAEVNVPNVDYNGERMSGIGYVQTTTFEGSRWSANHAYLYPAAERQNLFVKKNCLVRKVIIRNRRAVGVEYLRAGKVEKVFATKEVILSAGAINSPQLLMLSGVGPRAHLEEFSIPIIQDLPVGENLVDHSMFLGFIITLDSKVQDSRDEYITNLRNYEEYFLNGTGPLSSTRSVDTIAFLEISEEARRKSWPDVEAFVFTQPDILSKTSAQNYGFDEVFYETFAAPLRGRSAFQPVLLNLRPRSRGTVRLRSKSISESPEINPNYYSNAEDTELLVDAIKQALTLFRSGPFRKLGAKVYDTPLPACASIPFGTDAYWSCAVRWGSSTIYHPCCTAKMGPDGDSAAVVTPDLKVRGIMGLRVVDISVAPMIPTGHTMMPAYLIGEKGADIIKKSYGF